VSGEGKGAHQTPVLDNACVEVPSGTVVCVVDVGGISRASLLKIVGNMVRPRLGEVLFRGTLAAVDQLGMLAMPYQTARKNLVVLGELFGLKRRDVLAAMPAIEAFSGRPELLDLPTRRVPKRDFIDLCLSTVCTAPIDIIVAEDIDRIGSMKIGAWGDALFSCH
jgi:lipopolysaccharide transport system ATP-binding protein